MTLQSIPLSKLRAPKANPRRSIDPNGIERLAASIRTDGLIQNLVVRKARRGSYEIVAGERRFRALTLLHERGEINSDHPVPVELRSFSDDEALRVATVENVQREALNPIDEADAFVRLLRDNRAVEDVAAEAGVSVQTVRRRLALASLCDQARERVLDGSLTLSLAEAMTLGTSDRQSEILESIDRGSGYDADDIRSMLLDDKPTVAIAIFPIERYLGTFTADLFATDETTYFDDIEQFHQLQRNAVEERAAFLRNGEAEWVEIVEAWSVALWQFDEDENEERGVLIHLHPRGHVVEHRGLIRRETDEAFTDASPAGALAPKERLEHPMTLIRYIAAHRTAAVQACLLANPRLAKEVAVLQLMSSPTHAGGISARAHQALRFLSNEQRPQTSYAVIEAEAQWLCEALPLARDEAETAWECLTSHRHDATELLPKLRALAGDRLDKLHLLLTTLSFGQETMEVLDIAHSDFEAVAIDLDIDMALLWRPDEAFLSRRNREQLITIARDSGASKVVVADRMTKKSDLVNRLAGFFQRLDHEGARNWLPESMRFSLSAHPPATPEPQIEAAA